MAQLHAQTIHGQPITEEQAKALIQLVAETPARGPTARI
jgi:hypothetical protein